MSAPARIWIALLGTAALVIAAATAARPAAGEGEDLRPPLIDMKEHVSKDGVVAIRLPQHWKERAKPPVFGAIAEFGGFIQPPPPNAEPDLLIEFRHVSAFAHPRLAQFMLPVDEFGTTRVDGSLGSGDGWVEETRKRPNNPTLGPMPVTLRGSGSFLAVETAAHGDGWWATRPARLARREAPAR